MQELDATGLVAATCHCSGDHDCELEAFVFVVVADGDGLTHGVEVLRDVVVGGVRLQPVAHAHVQVTLLHLEAVLIREEVIGVLDGEALEADNELLSLIRDRYGLHVDVPLNQRGVKSHPCFDDGRLIVAVSVYQSDLRYDVAPLHEHIRQVAVAQRVLGHWPENTRART